MDPSMLDTSHWSGSVGMNLGNSLYVNFTSDDKFDSRMEELCNRIKSLVTPISEILISDDAPKGDSNKRLEDLTVEEVVNVLNHIGLPNCEEYVRKQVIDGNTLAAVESLQDIEEM
eukprot:gene20482-26004_t